MNLELTQNAVAVEDAAESASRVDAVIVARVPQNRLHLVRGVFKRYRARRFNQTLPKVLLNLK